MTRTGGRPASSGVIQGKYALSVGLPDKLAPDGWSWTLLSDVARLETGHTPSRKHPEYWGGDVPWVGIKDATENHGRTINSTSQYTNTLGISNSSARILPTNTVCLSRTASVGYVVVMGRPMATSQDFVNWVCSKSISHHFLKYVLLAERESFFRFASGTTHQTIYFPEVKAFHVCLPPKDEQEIIAHILGTLDDKIELNRRTNETLEAMAQALFKSWFVDFDPVRAKAENRGPKLPANLDELFPDNLDGDGIPCGWHSGNLLDLCELKRGYDLPTSQRTPGAFPIVSSSGVSGFHHEAMAPGPGVVTGRYGTIGEVFFVKGDYWPLNTALYVKNFKENSVRYVYYALKQVDFQKFSDKAAVPGINRNHLHEAAMIIPPREVQVAFERLMSSTWNRQDANDAESSTLAALRDTLLPKLISGELRVKDAEKIVGRVA
ncbi:restriction endonuclease subunit S [Rhodoplanes elegans]|nr:restriction endonuclease subunit S [Rhodoplanes elegans]